jgi:hypothetical protein
LRRGLIRASLVQDRARDRSLIRIQHLEGAIERGAQESLALCDEPRAKRVLVVSLGRIGWGPLRHRSWFRRRALHAATAHAATAHAATATAHASTAHATTAHATTAHAATTRAATAGTATGATGAGCRWHLRRSIDLSRRRIDRIQSNREVAIELVQPIELVGAQLQSRALVDQQTDRGSRRGRERWRRWLFDDRRGA